jgi:citronellol/citronellal dehydrogenase
MSRQSSFTDRTLVVSGGSRGIGLAIALGAAKRGANVVLLAKTAEPHPRLPGTVYTAVTDVEAAGGKGVAVVGDVREEETCSAWSTTPAPSPPNRPRRCRPRSST